jgi:hypothetical protein
MVILLFTVRLNTKQLFNCELSRNVMLFHQRLILVLHQGKSFTGTSVERHEFRVIIFLIFGQTLPKNGKTRFSPLLYKIHFTIFSSDSESQKIKSEISIF